jgi:hypothetical protein
LQRRPGNPAFPAAPLPDVMDWTYTGNKHQPTQKSIHILKPHPYSHGSGIHHPHAPEYAPE